MVMRASLTTIPDPNPVPELGKWCEVESGEFVTISPQYLPHGIVLEITSSKEPGGLMTQVLRVPRNNTPSDAIIDGYEVIYSNGLQRFFPTPSQLSSQSQIEALVGVKYTFSVESDSSFVIHNDDGAEPVYYRIQNIADAVDYGTGVQIPAAGTDATIEGHLDTTKKVLGFTTRGLGRTKYTYCNEDSLGYGNKRVVVADGIGSNSHSELASHLLVESIIMDGADFDESIGDAAVNLRLHNENFDQLVVAYSSPDAVFAAAEVNGNEIRVVHAGDAKWRLFHNGKVLAASKDFSRVQELLDAGFITEKEAITHPEGNVITSTVLFGQKAFQTLTAPPGSIFMLCTDGLDGITDEEIMKLHKYHMNRYTVLDEIQKMVGMRNINNSIPALYREGKKVKLDYFDTAPCDNVTVMFVYF